MMKIQSRASLLAIILCASISCSTAFGATYILDTTVSSIEFRVRHMLISWVRGSFDEYSGSFDFDLKNRVISGTKLVLKVKSINTMHEMRDAELMLPKFFHGVKYPTIVFQQTGFKVLADGKLSLTGDMTIKGETRPVTLTGQYLGIMKNREGKRIIGFTATTEIGRKDFNLDWDVLTKNGALVIGQKITIELRVQGVEQ